MIRILSLGAGVQSSTLALMYATGDPRLGGQMVDAAIFADTQQEPAHVYAWLDWLETQLPFPVYRVTRGDLAEYATRIVTARKGHKYVLNGLPMKMAYEGGTAIGNRGCTTHFKVMPLRRRVLELVGGAAAVRAWRKGDRGTPLVELLIGISADEWGRAKPSRDPWSLHRHPLLEVGMTRAGCLQWMQEHDYPMPAKSACTFCPFHSDETWQDMKDNDPQSWASAVEFERKMHIATATAAAYNLTVASTDAGTPPVYLHSQLVPLDQVVLRPKHRGDQFGLWDSMTEECEGMCGV